MFSGQWVESSFFTESGEGVVKEGVKRLVVKEISGILVIEKVVVRG